jgi:hypothetical protein
VEVEREARTAASTSTRHTGHRPRARPLQRYYREITNVQMEMANAMNELAAAPVPSASRARGGTPDDHTL